MDHNGILVYTSEFQTRDPRSFPWWEEYDLLFNVDIVNLLLKNTGGRDRRLQFGIFVVLKALIVGGWMVVAWAKSLI